jgi:SAM-dependent methyltransferase
MQPEYEAKYHELEEQHWWFIAMREILLAMLLEIPRDAAILDIGCSGGPLLLALRQAGYTKAQGIDISWVAVEVAHQRGIERVEVMDGAALTYPDESFDVILASNVLEHIKDEDAALQSWRRVLKPSGRLIVFVPAYKALWSEHDEQGRHYRRYTSPSLGAALRKAGFLVTRIAYWNLALLPPVALVRWGMRLLPKRGQQDQLSATHPIVQRTLLGVLRAENRLITAGVNLPAGISAFALAQKPELG